MFELDFRLVYLVGSLIILLLFLIVFLLRKDLRKISLITGLLLIPSGPISEILFFRDYWFFPTLFEIKFLGVRITIEDLIFAFAAPVIGAFSYIIISNKTFNKPLKNYFSYIIRFLILSIILIAMFFGLTLLGNINSMFSIVATSILISIVLLIIRKDLLKAYLYTAVTAFIGAFIFYYLYILLIGEEYLYQVWLLDHNIFGLKLIGSVIPITELIFAATVIPCIYLFIMIASGLGIKNKN
ncbi:MAG: hypothetical protein AAB532_03310 [Patescibacteria group bacterium]